MHNRFDQLHRLLKDTHRLIRVDILGESHQGLVHVNLLIGDLQDEIVGRFFSTSTSEDLATFGLLLGSQPLPHTATVASLPEGAHLQFASLPQHYDIPSEKLTLIDEVSGQHFEVSILPAVIGRQKSNMAAGSVTVDLRDLPQGRYVSGRHARLTYQGGQYMVENLTPHNRLLVNGAPVEQGESKTIHDGTQIQVGRIVLRFVLA